VNELLLTEQQWAAQARVESVVLDKSYRAYPLGELVGRYMRTLRFEGAKRNTLESYETVLRLFVRHFRDFEDLQPFVRPGGVELLYDFLGHHWADSSAATKRHRLAVLRSFFDWAVRIDLLLGNPGDKVRLPKERSPERRPHEPDEIKRIASCQKRLQDKAAILIMGQLGLRKMECARIRARDVDLTNDVIYIGDSKSGKPFEQVIEFRDVREALTWWLREDPHPDEYLVARASGDRRKPLDESSVHRWFKRCLERAGSEDFPMHELRHSAGHFIHRATGDLIAAQKLLRHASVKTTQDYLHPSSEDLRARIRQSEGSSES
jgi:integrase